MSFAGDLRDYGMETILGALNVYDRPLQVAGAPVLPAIGLGKGSVFYVDPVNGSDNNAGNTPDEAFASTAKALSECTAWAGDVIVRMRGTEQLATQLEFNVADVTLLGLPVHCGKPEWCLYYSTAGLTTKAPIYITQPCRIIGIEVANQGYLAGAAIHVKYDSAATERGYWVELRDVSCVDWWGNAYGIYAEGGSHMRIVNCMFEDYTSGIHFKSSVTNNPTHNVVVGCMFRGCTNAIEHVTNCHHFDYAYNVMQDGTYFLKGKHAATGTAFIRGGWYDVANLNSVCDDTQANMKTNYNVIVFDDNNILP